jgi:tRNA pseudouridine55 synthase
VTRAPAEPEWFHALAEGDAVRLLPAGTPAAAPSSAATPAQASPPKSGILAVDKPGGMTSFGVVRTIRKAADVRKVGHAGTLDPGATGALIVCLGSATRVIGEIQAWPKRYLAQVTFGVTTDTYDADGAITATADPAGLTAADIEAALDGFRGPIVQKPPMYSAVRHEGRRLYDLARRGEEIPRDDRPVHVFEATLIGYQPPTAQLALVVSKGTYVRALAHDLGQVLGPGAHLATLRRTAVGRFDESTLVPLERVVAAFREDWWPRILYTLDHALEDLPAIVGSAETEADMRHGRQFEGPPPARAGRDSLRVYTSGGTFVGVAIWDAETGLWQPQRVF